VPRVKAPLGIVLVGATAAIVGSAATTPFWWAPVLLGAVALIVMRPVLGVVLTGAALPLSPVLIATVGGFALAVADALAILTMFALLIGRQQNDPTSFVRPARNLVLLAAPYALVGWWVTQRSTPTFDQYVTLVQRIEIVTVWLAFGLLTQRAGLLKTFLSFFLVSCCGVALLWMTSPGAGAVLGMQKNASAGYVGSALLLVLLFPMASRNRVAIGGVLAVGLLATGSRGTMLGVAAALILLLFAVQQWKKLVAPAVGLAVVGGAAFIALPAAVTDRILGRTGLNTVDIRGDFVRDAMSQWRAQPDGLGIGGYRQYLPQLQNILNYDPHNVYLLALVEGSWPLFIAFLWLVVGGLLIAFLARGHWIGFAALLVQVSTFVHCYVDVYWVRGTPAIGWLLVGASAALIATANRHHSGVATDGDDEPGEGEPVLHSVGVDQRQQRLHGRR